MSLRDSRFADVLDKVISQPRRDLVDQPRDEALRLAEAPAARKEPWSKYVPFPKGTELDVKGGVNIPFIKNITLDGTGTIEERTVEKLVFSFAVKVGENIAKARVTVNYKEDGSSNTTDFASSTTGQKVNNAPTHIQSLPDERVVTLIGDLKITTNFAEIPFLDPIILKVVHVRAKQDRVELETEHAGLPNGFLLATKKAPETKK